MKAALLRYAAGKPTRLPPRVTTHLVAAAYGQSVEDVRDWAADDFMDAMNLLEYTRGRS